MPSVLVRFDAELRLVDDEVPETLNYAAVQQAVQDSLGHMGVVVIDVTEYEHQPSNARDGDRAANSQSSAAHEQAGT